MSFLKKLASLFTGKPGSGGRSQEIYVLSTRCHEPMAAEIDLVNALSRVDAGDAAFYTRKVVQGSGRNRCFAQVEVEVWFDERKQILRHTVKGGRWLSAEEYAAERARFDAPPGESDAESEGNGGGSGGFG